MKKSRNKIFETNSSSIHSITVFDEKNGGYITGKNIFVGLGSYGWEYEVYDNPIDICEYLYTAICLIYKNDYKKYRDKIEDVLYKTVECTVRWEEPIFECEYDNEGKIMYCYLDNGEIDHGDELINWLEDIFKNDDLLIKTIFNGVIVTGNDNTYDEDFFEKNEDCYYFYLKGN